MVRNGTQETQYSEDIPGDDLQMPNPIDLGTYLDRWATKSPQRQNVAATVAHIAEGCRQIAALIARGALAGELGSETGKVSGVDPQKDIDVRANDILITALKNAPVATFASEELEWALPLNPGAPLAVAVDPIDGSSNIDANVSIGTIFTVLPVTGNGTDTSSFLQPGTKQLAAGFAVFGPFTSFTLTLGDGTKTFTLDARSGCFLLTHDNVEIPHSTREYAINSSNHRHWDETIRTYADDCLLGSDGPRGKNFNMRWTASPVADFYRILSRGGIFLYPGDLREGYGAGRLRLVYEANPLAWIVEQAGGSATSGSLRILELEPKSLHQRTPFVAGSKDEVDYVARLYSNPLGVGERSPLFGRRGLFRT